MHHARARICLPQTHIHALLQHFDCSGMIDLTLTKLFKPHFGLLCEVVMPAGEGEDDASQMEKSAHPPPSAVRPTNLLSFAANWLLVDCVSCCSPTAAARTRSSMSVFLLNPQSYNPKH